MSEIVRTVVELAPFIAGGDAIGAVTDYYMARKAADEREPVSEVMGDVNEMDMAPSSSSRVSRLKLVGEKAVSTLALTAALTATANAYAWLGTGQPGPHEPKVELVVDRSGATAYGDAPTAEAETNRIAKEFAEEDSVETTALVGKGGQILPSKPEDVPSVEPFGDAPLREAFSTAVADLRLAEKNNPVSTEDDKKSAAIVIATNGNEFGSPGDVINKADEVDARVDVIDTAQGTDAQTAAQFRRIAEKTGGEYIDREDQDKKNVAQQVAGDLAPSHDKKKKEDDKLPEKIIGILSLAALIRLLKDRRNMPLTFRGSKVK
ncbi:MAG TPA: hypothetical protein VFW77_04105 [Candidatus Saccharimonadales bacterium]|nr:hypothetical protein [Candidatus Saccharimonadales bacterium]